ncbi:hypothetical protein [Alkalilimnicola ehrlichii]|uniref:DUF4412 domain-containing protein n=1 Tax=Alkalilimnicola ehrlichii (strain ATCC BAA-1101 / DSM 17681 / MLHE-1) TaxID=187272 RepID=Q0A8G4_ALKEH|nr:hypothetical protein [Alkalilimnicola ehrlichii]ABI56873.1 hypothetical protein Mlg_1524 [Alkalilimnicola ehrlichii MLHE-1]
MQRSVTLTLGATLSASWLLLAGGQALADSRAVYQTDDGELTVEYRDADNLRIGIPGPERQFLMITDGQAYVVARDDDGWYAIDADQLRDLSGQTGSAAEDVRVEPLDEQVRVAGFTGARYRLEKGDSWAGEWEVVDEVVLTDDARLRDIGEAFQRIGELFEVIEQEAEVVGIGRVDMSEYTLLRSSDMELSGFSGDSLPDHTFSLPPNVRHRDLVAERQEGRDEAPGDDEPGWLTRQIRGTGEDARDDAAGETRGEVRDRVREGVRSLFD